MDQRERSGEIRVSKRGALIVLLVVVAVVAGWMTWQTRAYRSVWRLVAPATIDITVKAADTNQPLIDAATMVLELNSATYKADGTGKITIPKLYVGRVSLYTSSAGYATAYNEVRLKRGQNALEVALERELGLRVTVNGEVRDAVDGSLLADVAVKTEFGTATSDGEGHFSIANVPVGKLTVEASKAGFRTNTTELDVSEDGSAWLSLTPEGFVAFISNRDSGKRALYRASYDGQDVAKIVERVGDTEDYGAVMAPEGDNIAFLSTRAKRQGSDATEYAPELYLVHKDGSGLKRVSEHYDISSVGWSADGRFLAWVGYEEVSGRRSSHLFAYDVRSQDVRRIDQTNGFDGYYYFTPRGAGISWRMGSYNAEEPAPGLYYQNLSGGDAVRITDRANAYLSRFSENGTDVVYYYYDESDAHRYVTFNVKTGESTDYAPKPGSQSQPQRVASPDGKRVAYLAERDGQTDVYLADPNGGNERRLTTIGAAVSPITWDKTGRYIVFTVRRDGETALYVTGVADESYALKITDVSLEYDMGYYY